MLESQRVDQVYQHQALFRPESALQPPAFAELLKQLNHNKQLDKLLERYHLRDASLLRSD